MQIKPTEASGHYIRFRRTETGRRDANRRDAAKKTPHLADMSLGMTMNMAFEKRRRLRSENEAN
jgi:hypothetical protein